MCVICPTHHIFLDVSVKLKCPTLEEGTQNRQLSTIFRPKRVRVSKSRRMTWARHVACTGKRKKYAQNFSW